MFQIAKMAHFLNYYGQIKCIAQVSFFSFYAKHKVDLTFPN